MGKHKKTNNTIDIEEVNEMNEEKKDVKKKFNFNIQFDPKKFLIIGAVGAAIIGGILIVVKEFMGNDEDEKDSEDIHDVDIDSNFENIDEN